MNDCLDGQTVVAWGWEVLAFYRAWLNYGDEQDARHLQRHRRRGFSSLDAFFRAIPP